MSLNDVIVRPTKIMNNKIAKFQSYFSIKSQLNLSDFFSMKNIRLVDQLLQVKLFENFDF